MRIQNVNPSISFGKTAMMTCQIKKADTGKTVDATLYQLDTTNYNDLNEVRQSKRARCMHKDMQRDNNRLAPYREYYFIKDNKTQEVISCAETSRRYRTEQFPVPGQTTLIEVFEENDKYIDSAMPMLAFLARNSVDRDEKCLTAGFITDDFSSLEKANFTETRIGEWVLPKADCETMANDAEQRFNLDFII